MNARQRRTQRRVDNRNPFSITLTDSNQKTIHQAFKEWDDFIKSSPKPNIEIYPISTSIDGVTIDPRAMSFDISFDYLNNIADKITTNKDTSNNKES